MKERVIFIDGNEEYIEEAYTISGKMAVSVYDGRDYIFRSISGFRNGMLVVNLAKCETFAMTAELPADLSVDDVLTLTVWDLARMFAKR